PSSLPMSFVQNNWMLFLTLILSGGLLLWPYIQRLIAPIKEIGTVNAIQLINSGNAVLLDVRDTREYEGGRLPNAIHIPLAQLTARVQELAKMVSRPIVVYCERGGRTRPAQSILAKAGFKDIYHLNGGFASWKSAGLPVEK